MIKKIKEGQYKGQWENEHGVVYNEEYARRKAPELFKSVKKRSTPKRKK